MAAVAMEMEKMRVEQLKTRNRRIWRSTSSRTTSSTSATVFFLHDPTSSPKPGSTVAANVGLASMLGGTSRTCQALPVHDSPVAATEDPNLSMNPKTERVPIEQAQMNEIERGISLSLPSHLDLPPARAIFVETVSQALPGIHESSSQSYSLVPVRPLNQAAFDHVLSASCRFACSSDVPVTCRTEFATRESDDRTVSPNAPNVRKSFPASPTTSSASTSTGLKMMNTGLLDGSESYPHIPCDLLWADVTLDDGTFARAAVPSGASTGIYEAFDLRFGVSRLHTTLFLLLAVENINTIIGPALVGKDPTEQAAIDNFMVQQLDGTANEWGWCKQKLGVDAILVVSLAVCKAGAALKRIPLYKHIANLEGNRRLVLPVPAFNVINGGSHAGNKLAMQAVIMEKYGQVATYFRDTGGFIQKNEEGLELLKTAIAKAGYTGKVVIGMDVAASEFYKEDKTYDLNFKEENNDASQKITGDAFSNVYKSLVCDYTIVSIEDPFDQDDWEHYAKMTCEMGEHVQIVGDDLLVTNLVVDQIGSVTESIEAVKKSKAAGWGVMASCCSLGQQRSIANAFLPKMFCFSECTKLRIGETEDPFIADLSVVWPWSERLAKFNRLLRIEEELGAEAVYAGANFRKPVEPY
ncbi:hypothetical protein NL676_018065 [Syzygium grande]|nr:hypothetical protein NL676_018065 [Syzygium grande]